MMINHDYDNGYIMEAVVVVVVVVLVVMMNMLINIMTGRW